LKLPVSVIPNIPWEDRPANCSDVVWRYSANPIIPRNLTKSSNSIFNSAVVPFQGKFAGVFRCDNKKREMNIHNGKSDDGIHWHIEDDPIEWINNDPELSHFEHRYDPRVTWLEDRYYITWCNGYHGPTIGVGIRVRRRIRRSPRPARPPARRRRGGGPTGGSAGR